MDERRDGQPHANALRDGIEFVRVDFANAGDQPWVDLSGIILAGYAVSPYQLTAAIDPEKQPILYIGHGS